MDRVLLAIESLHVSYSTRSGDIPAVVDCSLRVQQGECVGLVGESGCGKTTVALAIMRYLGGNGHQMMEHGTGAEVFAAPYHPYTEALLLPFLRLIRCSSDRTSSSKDPYRASSIPPGAARSSPAVRVSSACCARQNVRLCNR